MKITETIHAFKHHFRLKVGEGNYVDRFVYSYILLGKKVCLVDAGVWATAPLLLDYLKQIGRSPEEISRVLLTHSHPDHIGGCVAIQKASNATFYAHRGEKAWIENIETQYRERPIPNFFELVEGSVKVKQELKEGDILTWDQGDEGKTIRVIETPGHSVGSLSFYFEEEGALITGDAVVAAGNLPIYSDFQSCVRSIQKLKKVPGVRHLLSSWHEPIAGAQIHATMEEGIRYLEKIDATVADLCRVLPSETSGEELSLRVLERMGIKVDKVLPMIRTAIESHRKK